MENRKLRIAISQGDINGIGYEILFKIFEEELMLELCTPVIYGSTRVEAFWRKRLEQKPEEHKKWVPVNDVSEVRDGRVNIINCGSREWMVDPGKATADSGQAAAEALFCATQDVMNGFCDVLVTAPINKAAMPKEVFPHKGHTDYLQKVAAEKPGESLMILCSGNTRVALATTHLPLNEVAGAITPELILQKLRLMEHSLIRDFGIVKPQIALLALNPHAGDKGLIGEQEQRIIKPAMEQAKALNIFVHGPFAADGFWGSPNTLDSFDGILAMYHDQGLAPFKTLYMDRGVNFTAGLSIVRTSPDHGTAYDIAGKGIASEVSMREAIYTAIDIYRNRRTYYEANRNPLRKLYFNRGKDDEKIDLTAEDDND